jgi:hypothetical protein
MLYGQIIDRYKNTPEDPMAMLLRCLACIVHHSASILATMVGNSGHDFSKISILHDPDLLRDLRPLVTTDPTPGIMAMVTGIPPHVELACQLKEILDNALELVVNIRDQTSRITEAVKTAIDEKSWDSGQVTGTRLREILATFQEESMGAVNARLDGIRAEFQRVAAGGGGADNDDNFNNFDEDEEPRGEGAQRQPQSAFAYDGHFYDVPQGFQFPNATLRQGLRFWLKGLTVSADGSKVVKPFRQLTAQGLPTGPLKNQFKVNWKPIFSYLEENEAYELSRNTHLMTDVAIERIYDQCVDFLKENVSYCFASLRTNPTKWGLGTWSLKTRRSTILKKGTVADKAKVAAATNRNRARVPGTRPGRQVATNPHYRYRQRQRVERLLRNNIPAGDNQQQEAAENDGEQQEQETTREEGREQGDVAEVDDDAEGDDAAPEEVEDAFANAFRHVELSEAARARGLVADQEAAEELRLDRQEQNATRNRVGDAVGEDGDRLYIIGTGGQAPVPGTAAHRAWQRGHVDNLPT